MKNFEEVLDPSAHFESPQSLATDPELSREQKIELLRRWYHDALELQVAEEEGMAGGERNLLQETVEALRSLEADAKPPPRR